MGRFNDSVSVSIIFVPTSFVEIRFVILNPYHFFQSIFFPLINEQVNYENIEEKTQ